MNVFLPNWLLIQGYNGEGSGAWGAPWFWPPPCDPGETGPPIAWPSGVSEYVLWTPGWGPGGPWGGPWGPPGTPCGGGPPMLLLYMTEGEWLLCDSGHGGYCEYGACWCGDDNGSFFWELAGLGGVTPPPLLPLPPPLPPPGPLPDPASVAAILQLYDEEVRLGLTGATGYCCWTSIVGESGRCWIPGSCQVCGSKPDVCCWWM